MDFVVTQVDRETIPDCCMTCQEILIDECTLVCNCSGCDVLPFQKCEEYQRLKYYGEYKTPYLLAI